MMERPIEVELPHKLGRDEAHRRIANNIHRLKDHIPGGSAHVQSNWIGEQLNLNIAAMGQTVAAQIEVEETKVRCRVMLPGMLAFFAGPIEAALSAKGGDILLEDKSKKD
ncbi:MAG TPA: polyhydroxyalkanoic acid system family protein [Sphingomicrobium sp.]